MADEPGKPKIAQASIEIDSPELAHLFNIKQIRKRLQGKEIVRLEIEISKETIELINAFRTSRDVLGLFT